MAKGPYVPDIDKLTSNDSERYLQSLRLECLKLVVESGLPNDKAEPWNRANKFYTYVLYGKPMGVA